MPNSAMQRYLYNSRILVLAVLESDEGKVKQKRTRDQGKNLQMLKLIMDAWRHMGSPHDRRIPTSLTCRSKTY